MFATPDCVIDEISVLGYVQTFVISTGPACIRIKEHAEFGRMVVDCDDPAGVDEWCVLSHGNMNGAACPDGDCSSVPVQGGSWGSIKALYR